MLGKCSAPELYPLSMVIILYVFLSPMYLFILSPFHLATSYFHYKPDLHWKHISPFIS